MFSFFVYLLVDNLLCMGLKSSAFVYELQSRLADQNRYKPLWHKFPNVDKESVDSCSLRVSENESDIFSGIRYRKSGKK